MTRAISHLIRLHRWRIDEQCRAVADAGRRVGDLSAALASIEEAFRREQESLRSGGELELFGYAAYAEHVRRQRRQIHAALIAAEDRLASARKQLADAYRESRKFELIKSELDRAAAAIAARREQARLDEAAATMRRTIAFR